MTETNRLYVLFHAEECGSTLPLVALRALRVPHEVVVCNFKETRRKEGPSYERLLKANPLAQFPTLITPEGSIMTEMAAIILYLQDRHARGTPWDINNLSTSQLAAFYRWLVFIPANLYSALTIGEFPERFVHVPADSGIDQKTVESWVSEAAHARRGEMWKIMERSVTKDLGDGEFMLGTHHPTFLDVLLALIAHFMSHASDDFGWLPQTCPSLFKSVMATLQIDVVREAFLESKLNQYLAAKSDA